MYDIVQIVIITADCFCCGTEHRAIIYRYLKWGNRRLQFCKPTWQGCRRIYRVSFLWCPRARHSGRIQSLFPPAQLVTAAVPMIKGISCSVYKTSCFLFPRYGLGGSGIESRWRRDFPHPSRPALGPTQLSVLWVQALSRG